MSEAQMSLLDDPVPTETDIPALLDRVLAYACDIDHALELVEAFGWRLYMVNPIPGSSYTVMLTKPKVRMLHPQYKYGPEVVVSDDYSTASFGSLYGAILLALTRAVVSVAYRPWAVEQFEISGELPIEIQNLPRISPTP